MHPSKFLKTILSAAFLTIVLTVPAFAATVTANQTVNVRAGASTSTRIVTVLKKNASRTVLATSGSWYKVKVNGQYGYVHKNNLTKSMSHRTDKTLADCVLRELPSADSRRLRGVEKDTTVTLTGTSGGWYRVSLAGQTGFLPKSKIDSFYDEVCETAHDLLGSRYVYGATGPNSFDCSGFTQYVYRQCGKSIPRTSSSQYASSKKVSKSSLKRGQLVFFSGSGGGSSVGHVGIYVGNGNIIHAANSSTGVITSSLSSSYYSSHYIGAGYY